MGGDARSIPAALPGGRTRDGPAGVLGTRHRAARPRGRAGAGPLAAHDARRRHPGRPIHGDLPQVPRGLEDRARPYVGRRSEPSGLGPDGEEIRVGARPDGRDVPHTGFLEHAAYAVTLLLGTRTIAASTRPPRNQPTVCSIASEATNSAGNEYQFQ